MDHRLRTLALEDVSSPRIGTTRPTSPIDNRLLWTSKFKFAAVRVRSVGITEVNNVGLSRTSCPPPPRLPVHRVDRKATDVYSNHNRRPVRCANTSHRFGPFPSLPIPSRTTHDARTYRVRHVTAVAACAVHVLDRGNGCRRPVAYGMRAYHTSVLIIIVTGRCYDIVFSQGDVNL